MSAGGWTFLILFVMAEGLFFAAATAGEHRERAGVVTPHQLATEAMIAVLIIACILLTIGHQDAVTTAELTP
jgi:hypothetical protein